jgi:methylenetetrahydrofolate dehydrogenase (NADP+) / methenyltetrahydrofolate cyclohydrolase
MSIDGKKIAGEILADIKNEMKILGSIPKVRAIVVSPTSATKSYLKIKTSRAHEAGMVLEVKEYDNSVTTQELIRIVQEKGVDAVIVQLPLPQHLATQEILNAIPKESDADVLGIHSTEAFIFGEEGALIPPVALAVRKILKSENIKISGKYVSVIGNGKLVGKPVAHDLMTQGAIVTTLSKESFELEKKNIINADIVICGAGSPHILTPELVKKGVVIIDAGTSDTQGSLVGDADPRCSEVASVFTPVPGGIGPITVACLFKNVAQIMKNKKEMSISPQI